MLSLEGMSGASKQMSAGAVYSCMTQVTPRVSAALCVGLQRLQRRESRGQSASPGKVARASARVPPCPIPVAGRQEQAQQTRHTRLLHTHTLQRAHTPTHRPATTHTNTHTHTHTHTPSRTRTRAHTPHPHPRPHTHTVTPWPSPTHSIALSVNTMCRTKQKPLSHRSSTTFKKTAPSSTLQDHPRLSCHCRAPPHDDSRILPLSSKMVSDSKKLLQRRKTRRSGGPSDLHEILVPLKATSVQFRGRRNQAQEIPHLPSVDCALLFLSIFQFRSNCRFSLSSSCAQDPDENGPNIRSPGIASKGIPDPKTELKPPAPGKKRRRTRNGMPARNHTGRNLVQVRKAAARLRSSSGRMLPMMSR